VKAGLTICPLLTLLVNDKLLRVTPVCRRQGSETLSGASRPQEQRLTVVSYLPLMEAHPSTSSWPASGPWTLPIGGFEVLHMTFGAFLVDIVAYGEGGGRAASGRAVAAPSAMVRLEGEFQLLEPGGEAVLLDPEKDEWAALTPLFALRHDRITSAVATSDGHLDVSFASGRRLLVGPHPAFENWEIAGPGFRLIATPGDGVAVFRDGEA
jgi:hypothetical protein